MTLDEARKALFVASRELSREHEARMRTFKSDMVAIERCRAADRELQARAIAFTAAFVRETAMSERTTAYRLGVAEMLEEVVAALGAPVLESGHTGGRQVPVRPFLWSSQAAPPGTKRCTCPRPRKVSSWNGQTGHVIDRDPECPLHGEEP